MSTPSLKQPRALYPLFFTELWERFGFYTVQTILVLYLTSGLGYRDEKAYLLYGTFNSLLYLTPFVGGYLADHYLGFRKCIFLGGILLCLGYLLMAFPMEHSLFLGMSIVIVGNGFFKPNVSSIVGSLYEQKDPRREGGFTLFYMGINIGSMLPSLFVGALVAAYTWGTGFGVASFGMVLSVGVFLATKRMVGRHGDAPVTKQSQAAKRPLFSILLITGILASIAICFVLFHYPKTSDLIVIVTSLAFVALILFFLSRQQKTAKNKLIACLVLIILSIGFWAIYMQAFTSLILFAKRNVHKEFLGIPINAEFTLFFNPFFIIALSPLLSRLWTKLQVKKKNPSIPLKFSLGILCISLGFFVLWAGSTLFHQEGITSLWWLIASYFTQTVGELLLSPIGLAMITHLAPKKLVGTMMGVWFLTLAASFAIGSELATLADIPSGTTVQESLRIYDKAFLIYAIIAGLLAILSFILIPYLKKLISAPSTPISTPKE